MEISRNIKKLTPKTTQTNYATPPGDKKHRLGKYRFPMIDEVPSGYYMSRIMHARNVRTKSGKDAVELFYKMLPLNYCYQIVNNIIPEDPKIKPFFVRQRYPKDSMYYEEFEYAMFEALDADADYELDLNDIIGLEERINLTYASDTAFGGIKDRVVCSMDDLVNEQDEEEITHTDEDEYAYDEYDDDGYIG